MKNNLFIPKAVGLFMVSIEIRLLSAKQFNKILNLRKRNHKNHQLKAYFVSMLNNIVAY